MDIVIREYREADREALRDCMEKLQDYIVSVDPLKRVRRAPEFGEEYTKWLLELIHGKNGIIYFAYLRGQTEKEGKVIGCCAGIMSPQAPHDVAAVVPSKHGRVQELYVDSKYRGEGVGKALMEKIEEYFRKNGCDTVMLEVFAPNKSAYAFYQSCGYLDRDINMMKKL